MNGKRFSEKKSRANGFYLALAVCLAAVGIAAWSTYDAVHSYVESEGTVINSSAAASSMIQKQNEDVRREQETSSDAQREDPEASRAPASTPAPSRQTAAAVGKQPETSKPDAGASQDSPAEPEEPQVPVNAPLYEISTQLIYPLASQELTKPYSSGAPVYSETMRDWRVHTGMDEKAEANEEVRACANGQVKQAYSDRMLGNVLVIEHGDYEFSYCGLGENFQVREGDIVTKGQVIGIVTAVPSEAADAAHLHLEVRRDGVYMDPQTVIEDR